jgi:hypothetical protein
MMRAMTARIEYPSPLRPGGRIAVTAPNSGVAAALHPRRRAHRTDALLNR